MVGTSGGFMKKETLKMHIIKNDRLLSQIKMEQTHIARKEKQVDDLKANLDRALDSEERMRREKHVLSLRIRTLIHTIKVLSEIVPEPL